MANKPKSKWLWRLTRWGLIGVTVLVTLAAILITEENWRGKRDWENYKQMAAARGERFDETVFNTNDVPDDQNFIKAQIFSDLADLKWNAATYEWEPQNTNSGAAGISIYWSGNIGPSSGLGDFNRARMIDLKAWQAYYNNSATNESGESSATPKAQSPAADVLLALSRYNRAVEALRDACRRPVARLGNYNWADFKSSGLLMAYASDMKRCLQLIELRSLAELADGQTTNAFNDITLMGQLNDKVRQEPLLISHLVSLATMNLLLQPVYEGLARHQWTDEQLADLERMLAAKDFLADYQKAMRGEGAYAINAFEGMRLNREYASEDSSSGTNQMVTVRLGLMPSAFFYQNELNLARLDEQMLSLVDLEKRTAMPAAQHRVSSDFSKAEKKFNPYRIFAMMTAQSFIKVVSKFAAVQTQNDSAQIACALERYRLAHGKYPDSLDALAPKFIEQVPHDVINGQPLHYHLTADGTFVLYSVGWNETDDKGQIVLNKSGSIDRDKGDWVWQYPTQ